MDMNPLSPEAWSLELAAHLLNRTTFCATPDDIEKVYEMGHRQAVAALVAGELRVRTLGAPPLEPGWYHHEDEELEELQQELRELRQSRNDVKNPQGLDAIRKRERELRGKVNTKRRERGNDITEWWFETLCTTNDPLNEKMTLFWHGHFATSLEKVRDARLMMQQNMTFREHGLGDIRSLTKLMAFDPAMMLYLDIHASNQKKPNENYGRELLELFTLGEGHYSEADIKHAARAFTGIRLDRKTGVAKLIPKQHDNGPKKFLGEAGRHGPDDIVDIIFSKDRPSEFFAHKLLRYFLVDSPPREMVMALALEMRRVKYDMRLTLQSLLSAEWFFRQPFVRARIKSPIEFLTQMIAQLELSAIPEKFVSRCQRELGQQLFRPPNVAGWPGAKIWINTNTLLNRYNIAGVFARGYSDPDYAVEALALMGGRRKSKAKGDEMNERRKKRLLAEIRGKFPRPNFDKIAPDDLRRMPDQMVDHLAFRFYQFAMRDDDRSSFIAFAEERTNGGKAMSDGDLAELVHLMLSTPYYQLT